MGKIFPLVNYCLKSYKHSSHYKLCCRDHKISHINAHAKSKGHKNTHAKSKGHKNNVKSKKGQRTFTISSDLSLSKSSIHLKNTAYFSRSPHEILKLSIHPLPPFLGNSLLYIGFSDTQKSEMFNLNI